MMLRSSADPAKTIAASLGLARICRRYPPPFVSRFVCRLVSGFIHGRMTKSLRRRRMRMTKHGLVLAMAATGALQTAEAQLEVSGSGDSCAQIESLRKAGKVGEARTQAQACLDALNQEANGAVAQLFPAT